MKIGWVIIGAGAAYFLYKSYSIARAINTFRYSIRSIRYNVTNSDVLRTQFDVTLEVDNITSQPISFNSFYGSLYIKNVPVANFYIANNNNIVINPGTNNLTFPVSFSNLNLVADIKAIIDDWKLDDSDALVSIQGTLTAAGLSLPVKQTLILNQDAVINGVGEYDTENDLPGFFKFSNY